VTTTHGDPTSRLLGADLRRDDAEAIRFGEQALTWAQLGDRVDRIAAGLVAEGVQPATRIAFLDKNHPACLEAAYGGARVGAVTTVVNWRLAPQEWHYVLDDSQAELLFVGAEFAAQAAQLRDRLPQLRKTVVIGGDDDEYEPWLAAHQPRDARGEQANPDDVVLQLYTSGTTGFPKGVMLTHRNVAAHNAAAVESSRRRRTPSRWCRCRCTTWAGSRTPCGTWPPGRASSSYASRSRRCCSTRSSSRA
jgi:acyl-CoA synthetase (AMP-forming)/AMP-acid ligase II